MMKCLIKEFANLARINDWKVEVVDDRKGYFVFYQKNEMTEPIKLVTQKNEIRYWKSLDVLIKHLTNAGFYGDIIIYLYHEDEN